MKISGTIAKINNELNYGFIKVPKLGDVFFSESSDFKGLTFEFLKIGQKVQIEVTETERGLFAKSLSFEQVKRPIRQPEANL